MAEEHPAQTADEPYVVFDTEVYRALVEPIPPSRNRRWLTIVAAVLIVVGAGMAAIWPREKPSFLTVSRGDIIHSIAALGRVEPEELIEISPTSPMRLETVHVVEGDRVKPGQVLVTLDTSVLLAQRDELQATLEAAQARLAELQRGTRPERLDAARATATAAAAELSRAQARLAELDKGARAEERDQAQARGRAAKADLEVQQKTYRRLEALWKDHVVTGQALDEARARCEAAQAHVEEAQAVSAQLANGPTEEARRQGQSDVEHAEAVQAHARAQLAELTAGATREQLDAAQAAVRQAEATLRRIDKELDAARLKAPREAVVVRVLHFSGETPQGPVVLLAAGERIIRAEVNETDVFKVRVGQFCSVTSESYPGRILHGRVVELAYVMGQKRFATEHPKEKSDLKVLEVKVKLETSEALPIYVPVEVRIQEVVKKDVVRAPVQALRTVDGKTLVSTPVSEREIHSGARDEQYVEVLCGLAEGDQILPGTR